MLSTPTPPFPPQSRTAHALHARLLSWFRDAPAAPFGLHRMALAATAAGKDVGAERGGGSFELVVMFFNPPLFLLPPDLPFSASFSLLLGISATLLAHTHLVSPRPLPTLIPSCR
ncbi:hypothetical protein DFH06DRAFT_1336616 [Mycena polygramma]|nr:hypothetical protein DFH06DRAFT_1336616 [Mycena polygramma]